MGTYLSTPITSKHVESGSDLPADSSGTSLPVSWGVVDMQGWRKSMEDAHVARTDVGVGGDAGGGGAGGRRNAKVFAVFDGHGGAEVARFCQIHLVEVLTAQEGWKGIRSDESDATGEAPPANGRPSGSRDALADGIAGALISSFHALDRLIDDPSKREEIERWRSERPSAHAPDLRSVDGGSDGDPDASGAGDAPADAAEKGRGAASEGGPRGPDPSIAAAAGLRDLHLIGDSGQDDYDSDESGGGEAGRREGSDAAPGGGSAAEGAGSRGERVGEGDDGGGAGKEGGGNPSPLPDAPSSDSLDSPEGIVRDDSDSEDSDEDEPARGMVVAEAYSLITKLLHMNGGSEEEEEEESLEKEEAEEGTAAPTQEQLLNPPSGIVAPSAAIPTKIQNGRKVCNLPDHPVHAGCTSVVAVIVDKTLVVANAGDSRAVLCRAGGLAEPLSFDHKPLQKREMNRITKAGGFVNQFGRVNGNLNLSRSIGDLKYKQVPGIAPADQMITAEPDIISTTLRPGDEFIILGCDGIWDCLSNEECVKYVRDRIDTKPPSEIGVEMLDEIVSEDPRASQGIGGDNMTIMIIDLLPQSRKWYVQQ